MKPLVAKARRLSVRRQFLTGVYRFISLRVSFLCHGRFHFHILARAGPNNQISFCVIVGAHAKINESGVRLFIILKYTNHMRRLFTFVSFPLFDLKET